MRRTPFLVIASIVVSAMVASAADRAWRRGIWVEVTVKRPRFVIGMQPSPRNRGQSPEMTVVRTYVIDSEDLRLELKEPMPAPLRSVDAMVGDEVTFALEKNTVYVRGTDGIEYRLQVVKRGNPPKEKEQR